MIRIYKRQEEIIMLNKDNRLIVNEDDTHFYYTRSWNNIEPDRAEIERFADQYKPENVFEVILTCAGRMSSRPSACRESFLDKYYQKFENGAEVDYTQHPVIKCVHRIAELGLDFYDIALKRLRENGVQGWLSVRMNDIHESYTPQCFLHPDFYHEHPEYRRIRYRENLGYFDRCYDYARPEIREYMLTYIEEIAGVYDFDGLELDWQRESFCFAPGEEENGAEILNGFTRDVRRVLDDMEKRVGHKIGLGVRVPSTPEVCLGAGFDVAVWAREGLISQVSPCSRWETTDTDIPVEIWKRLLAGTDVLLAPGTEVLLHSEPDKPIQSNTTETTVGTAAAYHSAGADAFYLFNYMDTPVEKPDASFPGKPGEYAHLLDVLGSPEKLRKLSRRHVLSYNDMGPVWFDKCKGAALPLAVRPRCPAFLRIRTGKIPEGKTVYLRLGISSADVDVYVNTVKAVPAEGAPFEDGRSSFGCSIYRLRNSSYTEHQVVEFVSRGQNLTVDYAEIFIPEE